MKFRIESTYDANASKDRKREWEQALVDLSAETDGAPPTITVALAPDGGGRFEIISAEGEAVTVTLPYDRIKGCFRDYGDIIQRLARSDGGAFGMRDFETLDYAKKLVHDEGGDLIRRALRSHVPVQLSVARRVFTLLILMSSDLPEAAIRQHRRHGGDV